MGTGNNRESDAAWVKLRTICPKCGAMALYATLINRPDGASVVVAECLTCAGREAFHVPMVPDVFDVFREPRGLRSA